jgi:N-acetylmuramoyl-L-alanine amidase
MQIVDDWIKNVRKRDLSSAGNNNNPGFANTRVTRKRIVVHYTAGSTLSGAVQTLRDKGFSYHVLIDTDGEPYQTRPFTVRALHAGRSNWKEASGVTNSTSLNADGIGISLVNIGQYGYFHQGVWFWDFDRGTQTFKPPRVRDEDATKGALPYRPGRPTAWEPYKPSQVKTCREIIKTLVEHYDSFEEIVGHHDIAIDEKPDPGPLIPLEDWRSEFSKKGGLGFRTEVKSPDGELNLRDRPNVSDGRVIKVLRNGDVVHIRAIPYSSRAQLAIIPGNSGRFLTAWASVDINGSNKHAGFVLMKFLKSTPLAREYQQAL